MENQKNGSSIMSYPLDQLFNKIRKKKIINSKKDQSSNLENALEIELIEKFNQELNEKLKSIRKSLKNNG